jgi:hypothetical protein
MTRTLLAALAVALATPASAQYYYGPALWWGCGTTASHPVSLPIATA